MLKLQLSLESLTSELQLELLPEEKEPYLRIFFSGHLSKVRDSWIVPLPPRGERASLFIESRDVPKRVDGTYACIGIAMMCRLEITNDKKEYMGYSRYEPIAGGMIPISRVIGKKSSSFDVNMVDRTNFGSIQFTRGVLRVITSDVVSSGWKMDGAYSERMNEERERKMLDMIDSHEKMFSRRLLPTRRNCRPMHIKIYFTEISGTKIPACAFSFTESTYAALDEGFLEHIVRSAVYVSGWKDSELVKVVETQIASSKSYDWKFSFACQIVAVACCLVSNACDYVSDHSGKSDSERFIHILQTLCGDCEDSGRMAYLFAAMLFHSKPPNKLKHPLSYTAWLVCRLYVPVVITGIATCPSQDSRNKGQMEDICHIYGNMIPRAWFCDAIEADDDTRDMFESMVPFSSWENRLPALMLEGTNFCGPLVGPMGCYSNDEEELKRFEGTSRGVRTTEASFPALTSLSISSRNNYPKHRSFHSVEEEKFSDFYRRPIELWTDILIRNGKGSAAFSIGYGDQTRGTNDSGYGVDFRDWMSLRQGITLIPILDIDKDDYARMLNVLLQEAPTRMEKDPRNAPKPDISRLEVLCKTYPRRDNSVTTSYFANHVKKLNDNVISGLESALKHGYFTHIECSHIPLTLDGELYIIFISVGVATRLLE